MVRTMDTQLESYIEHVMEQQKYRAGIFSGMFSTTKNAIIKGMAAVKAPSWSEHARI